MAIDLRDDSTSTKAPASQQQAWARMEKTLDFSVTGRTAADELQIFRIPAYAAIKVYANVVTAEGGTFTFDIDTDESSPQSLIAAANGNTTGVKVSDGADGDAAIVEFQILGAACNLVLTVNHTVDAAKIQVTVLMLDLGAKATDNYTHAST